MSLLRLYERIRIAVTAPIKIAIFFPGRRFKAVRSEITSVIGLNIHNLLIWLSGYDSVSGGSLSRRLFFIKFKFIICFKIAKTSFLRISTPLKLVFNGEKSGEIQRTCQWRRQCWHHFAFFLQCQRSRIIQQCDNLCDWFLLNNRIYENWQF